MCGCTVVQGQMPTLPKHTRPLSPSVGPSIPAVGGEGGNAALWLLPPFHQAASRFPASPEGIITINTDSISLPCSRDCCEVGCGWHRNICLASSRSATSAGRESPQSRHSHSGVRKRCQSAHNFCSLCFKMKLINKGRNVSLSKVLTSKSKYLHRCAGCCQLLGTAMFLDQFMPPAAPALFLHCSGPAVPWEASSPGGGQGLEHRGRREGLNQDAQERGCWAPGLFAHEGHLLQPSCFRISFFPSSRMSFGPSFSVGNEVCATGSGMAVVVAHDVEVLVFRGAAGKAAGTCSLLFSARSLSPVASYM